MPCRSEKSVATADQQGKQADPLTNASENSATDNTNAVDGKDKNQKKSKETGKSTGEDNKENSGESATLEGRQGQNGSTGKSSDPCRGNKSVQIKDTTKPVDKTEGGRDKAKPKLGSKGNVADESGAKDNVDKTTEAPKKSSGLCRSDKDLQVIDSVQGEQVKPDTPDSKARNGRKTPNTGSKASLKAEGDGQSPNGASSGGFCRKKTDVAVTDSIRKEVDQPMGVQSKVSGLERKPGERKASETDSKAKDGASRSQSTNQKPPTGRSGSCCGGRSVEVTESVRPLDKPEKEKAEPDPSSEPKTAVDDTFGEPIYSGLDDLESDEEEETLVKKVVEEDSFEEIDDNNVDDVEESDDEEKIIVRPEPPPPEIKKKKKGKKKKATNEYVEATPTKGGPLAMNPRKGKYSVASPDQEEEPLYAQVERTPVKKQSQAKLGSAIEMDIRDTPVKKKKKKKMETETHDDIRSAYENQIASLAATSGSEGGYTINDHPTVEEESELLENAEAERKKNKQRLREKKLRETGGESPVKRGDATNQAYENAQREINKVLAPKIVAEDEEEDSDGSGKKKKKKQKDKSKKKKKSKGENNGGYSSDEKQEESLEEAKARMHQLLDDAFSLFSHSRSSMSNKVAPSKQSSEEKKSPKTKKKDSPRSKESSTKSSPRDESKKSSPRQEEKKHTPMNIIRSHEPYDRSGLITWDPYKASDETAVISLPTTQTNLSSQPPQQEKLTTSTFTETLPGSLRPNYYATQPAEPIVIKSSELEDSGGRDFYMSPRHVAASHAPVPDGVGSLQKRVDHHGMFQNPLYEDSYSHAHPPESRSHPSNVKAASRHAPPYHQQPTRHPDRHYEPYYGLSSYHEIPQSSTIPGQVDQFMDSNPHRHREASTLNGIDTLDFSNPTYNGRDSIGRGSNNYPHHHEMLARSSDERSRQAEGGEIRSHTAPQRGENPNLDVVDAVSGSLRPGASPQPLINSLREELQVLASRRGAKDANATGGTATRGSINNGFQSSR